MNLKRIELSMLIPSDQPRPLLTTEVDKLSASIREVGLIQPITVKAAVEISGIAEPCFQIVAGHHRVAACRALGWTEIDALVIEDTSHLQTELIEIDENLCRAELSSGQRTKYTKRREQIWEALHPDEIQVRQAVAPELKATGYKQPPPQSKGFAASTAEVTGESVRSVQREIARANAIGLDTLDKITNTSLDSGVELDALAKLPEPERAALIEQAAAGVQVSARPAKPVQAAPVPDAPSDTTRTLDLASFAKGIKESLRSVLDAHGCLSIKELQQTVNSEIKTATEDEVEAICDTIDYLEQWCKALSGIDLVALARRV